MALSSVNGYSIHANLSAGERNTERINRSIESNGYGVAIGSYGVSCGVSQSCGEISHRLAGVNREDDLGNLLAFNCWWKSPSRW